MHIWKHFATVTKHRWLVMCGCFRVGLIRQGLTHDLSKYAPVEFLNGARYYLGYRSPNTRERDAKGYSEAWIHHKGRNPHHFEYWTDLDRATRTYVPIPIPRRYLAEMIMDRRAACMVYQGKNYTDASALTYFEKSPDRQLMHKDLVRQLDYILTMLKEKGETETFCYIKETVLTGKPFPWEE